MMSEYIVYCSADRHAIGTLVSCERCQKYRQEKEKMGKHKTEQQEYPPLVDASTPMYRDETFWLFNYPDEEERERAQNEYEQYNYDKLLAEIESMPDIRED